VSGAKGQEHRVEANSWARHAPPPPAPPTPPPPAPPELPTGARQRPPAVRGGCHPPRHPSATMLRYPVTLAPRPPQPHSLLPLRPAPPLHSAPPWICCTSRGGRCFRTHLPLTSDNKRTGQHCQWRHGSGRRCKRTWSSPISARQLFDERPCEDWAKPAQLCYSG